MTKRPDASLDFVPVIIVGAGRSGTNILRDCLTALPGFATWDCDEINPVWRHGNVFAPDDALPVAAARQRVRRYIRGTFRKIWLQTGCTDFIVEKTCANSLRIPFVDQVLPEAKYLYLVRDGGDVIPSAVKRWRGNLEVPMLPYYLAKIRYAPIMDLPLYGWRFVASRIGMIIGNYTHMSTWGPRCRWMAADAGRPLEEICARQWTSCVDASDHAFAKMAPGRVLKVRYEDFTSTPQAELSRVLAFLGAEVPTEAIASATLGVRSGSVGKGRSTLDTAALSAIRPIIAQVMARHDYEI